MGGILLTGFEPFGGDADNPSQQVARALDGEVLHGHAIHGAVLPTAFGSASDQLLGHMARTRSSLVLCLGQAGGRPAPSIERIAINLVDARIADNAGMQPVDLAVVEGGPAAYFSSLPIKAMHAALRDAGIASEISNTAGTFVCNAVFYALMHALAPSPGVRGGFMHLPWLPGQGLPAMPLETMVRAVRLVLAAAVSHVQDIRLGAGKLE